MGIVDWGYFMSRKCRSWAQALIVLIVVVLAADAMQLAIAQRPSARNPRDEAAVARASKDYLAALDRGDAAAIAEFWTPDGTYTDETGQVFKARDLVAKVVAAKSVARPSASLNNITLRFVTPDVVMEEGVCEMPSTAGAKALHGRFSATWVRQNDRWRLDSLREWRTSSNSGGKHLVPLQPFLGEWLGQTGNRSIRVSVKWNLGKTFLNREFSVLTDGQESFHGTQQIGWDPLTEQIRSWTFNSDGSRTEGIWSLEGNVWMVASQGAMPDGELSTATHVFKFQDKNTMVFKSISGEIGGKPTPDFEMKLVRQKSS